MMKSLGILQDRKMRSMEGEGVSKRTHNHFKKLKSIKFLFPRGFTSIFAWSHSPLWLFIAANIEEVVPLPPRLACATMTTANFVLTVPHHLPRWQGTVGRSRLLVEAVAELYRNPSLTCAHNYLQDGRERKYGTIPTGIQVQVNACQQ